MILKCPVNVANIRNAHNIFGTDVVSVNRKTVRSNTEPVVSHHITILPIIMEQNSELDLTGGIYFVNKIPFLVTLG